MISLVAYQPDYTAPSRPVISEERAPEDDYDRLDRKQFSRATEHKPLEGAISTTNFLNNTVTSSGIKDPGIKRAVRESSGVFGSKSAKIIVDAYLTRVHGLMSQWVIANNSSGVDINDAGLVIRLSEKYLKALNHYANYR